MGRLQRTVVSFQSPFTSHHVGKASHPQVAVIGNMVEVLLRTAWAVGDEGLCHFEDCNRERNQFFMEILGFAWAFENPHSKCSGKGNVPQQKARGLGLPQL